MIRAVRAIIARHLCSKFQFRAVGGGEFDFWHNSDVLAGEEAGGKVECVLCFFHGRFCLWFVGSFGRLVPEIRLGGGRVRPPLGYVPSLASERSMGLLEI